jgi:hypothetical protein
MDNSILAFNDWYASLRPRRGGEPPRTAIGTGLVVLDFFAEHFPLLPEHYLTAGGQVRSLNGTTVARILSRFGENRVFSREGGRTSRGARTFAESLSAKLNEVPHMGELTADERKSIAEELQRRLAERATIHYLNRSRLSVEISLTKPTADIVADILAAAAQKNIAGAVAQHLVGAKLALRYPAHDIPNHSYTTADQQLGRPGDFFIGDTAMHVTVAPMEQLLERCRANLRAGHRALLIVPSGRLEATRQLAEIAGLHDRLGIADVETFVGQNVEELAGFARDGVREQIRELLRIYNERVQAVETDPGLLIEIPEI